MVAFKDYPPEVQRQALCRSGRRNGALAERSDQPRSPDAKLQQRLADLPELPEAATSDPQAPPPTRIATAPTSEHLRHRRAIQFDWRPRKRTGSAAFDRRTENQAESSGRPTGRPIRHRKAPFQPAVAADVDETDTIARVSTATEIDRRPIAESLSDMEADSDTKPVQLSSDPCSLNC